MAAGLFFAAGELPQRRAEAAGLDRVPLAVVGIAAHQLAGKHELRTQRETRQSLAFVDAIVQHAHEQVLKDIKDYMLEARK